MGFVAVISHRMTGLNFSSDLYLWKRALPTLPSEENVRDAVEGILQRSHAMSPEDMDIDKLYKFDPDEAEAQDVVYVDSLYHELGKVSI